MAMVGRRLRSAQIGARASRGERLVEYLDESRAVERVTLAFIQLHELLDLLAHRPLDDARLGRDHIAAFRARLKEGLLNRDCNVVRLRVSVWIRRSTASMYFAFASCGSRASMLLLMLLRWLPGSTTLT